MKSMKQWNVLQKASKQTIFREKQIEIIELSKDLWVT